MGFGEDFVGYFVFDGEFEVFVDVDVGEVFDVEVGEGVGNGFVLWVEQFGFGYDVDDDGGYDGFKSCGWMGEFSLLFCLFLFFWCFCVVC